MLLDYGTQISPLPIKLSIGELRKPKLIDIADISFDKFFYYETFISLTAEVYYTKVKSGGKEYWDSLSEEEQFNISLYSIIEQDKELQNVYVEIFNFFFVQSVIFREGYFVLLKQPINEMDKDIERDMIRGAISKDSFPQVIELIQQICCIYKKEDNIDNLKFKNEFQKKHYLKMLKAKKKVQKEKKADKNLSIPNIISVVSSFHPSINFTNVFELTIFQLMECFNRLQADKVFEIDSTRVSVWGDEKKTFDFSLWFKNDFDN